MTDKAAATPVVQVQGLEKSFFVRGVGWGKTERKVLHGIDLEIKPGEVIGVVGESGSGKTTLGKCLLRIVEPTAGTIHFEGKEVTRLNQRELRRMRSGFQMVYQNPAACLNPALTVEQHLVETARVHLQLSGAPLEAAIDEILQRCRLYGKRKAYPGSLSGGEKRRVSLARCLLPRPRFVVADEPTAGLDASVKADALELMMEQRHDGMAYLFISHELATIRFVSDRVFVLFQGRVMEEAPVGSLESWEGNQHHPYTRELFFSALSQGNAAESTQSARTGAWQPPPTRGCPYRLRCAHIQSGLAPVEKCKSQHPPLISIGAGHRVACYVHP